MMRIGVDARELAGHPTGVGRYLRELLQRWQRDPACAGATLTLCSPESAAPAGLLSAGTGARLQWHHVPGVAGTWWEQMTLPGVIASQSLDAWFAPAYTAPLRLRVPLVVAMHDVSFAAHPEWYAWRHGVRLRAVARWSARKAARVVTLTHFSASEITRHLGVPPDRVCVVPLAVDYMDAAPAAPPSTTVPLRVLFVGSIFERRHLPLLMEGVARARQAVPDLALEVIGDNRTTPSLDFDTLAASLGLQDAFTLRAYVSDQELEAAYASAGAFAFLSSYEGFGLTPLEAMRHHVPVVVMDTPVAREVYGDGARYVAPNDAGGVSEALVALLAHPDDRQAAIAAGDATVARYRWEATAGATWQVLRDVVEGRAT
ncbi:MAG TPA: glycosyltransferase family 1 protein [Luteitalea sp.]|nr:glycosyltransferase family 1 protein [Luteitalea sp.]